MGTAKQELAGADACATWRSRSRLRNSGLKLLWWLRFHPVGVRRQGNWRGKVTFRRTLKPVFGFDAVRGVA
jgi:hypothetical protein